MTFFFDPANFSLSRDDDGVLHLHRDGQNTRLGAPRRALPLSQPEGFIVLLDEDGNEIGVIRAPEELDETSRALLEEELKVAYRIERIVRVLKVEKEPLSGQTRWQVGIAIEKTGESEDSQNDEDDAPTDAASTRDSIFSRLSSDEKSDDTPGVLEKLRRKRRASSADDETLFGDMDVTESEEREFFINGQEDVQTARYPHIFIVDAERNRYEILDCEALDVESRRAAERFF